MRFGEGDAAGVLRGEVVRDHVLHERDLSAGIALLLEPREPEHVRLQRRHDIVELVAVDVVHAHLGAAGRSAAVLTAEGLGMVRPHPGRRLRGLLPPSVDVEDVDAAVAVDVAGADAMRSVRALLANLRREPRVRSGSPDRASPIASRLRSHTRDRACRRHRCPSSPTLPRRWAPAARRPGSNPSASARLSDSRTDRVFEVDASSTSGQPSPVKSPANSSQFDEKLVEGLVESAM